MKHDEAIDKAWELLLSGQFDGCVAAIELAREIRLNERYPPDEKPAPKPKGKKGGTSNQPIVKFDAAALRAGG